MFERCASLVLMVSMALHKLREQMNEVEGRFKGLYINFIICYISSCLSDAQGRTWKKFNIDQILSD